jgi:hypothetical protein
LVLWFQIVLEAISKPIKNNDKTGKVKEGSIHINFSLMPYQQATIITKPSEGSLNLPALTITPEFYNLLNILYIVPLTKPSTIF